MLKDRAQIARRERERASRRATRLSTRLQREALKDAIRELREESNAIRELVRAERDGFTRSSSGHIDHTPGGSPSPYPPAASAPDRTWHPPKSFRVHERRTPTDRITPLELLARANRAAKQAMRDKRWSHEDRQDAASYAVESVIRRAAERVGGDKLSDLPAELATGVALYRLARDCRESKVASADRDQADAIAASFRNVPDPEDTPGEVAADVTRYPVHAIRFAHDACIELGVPTTGPTFTIAYTAARLQSEESQAAVAAELGMTSKALDKLMQRTDRHFPCLRVDKRRKDPTRYRSRYLARGSHSDLALSFLEALASLDRREAGSLNPQAASMGDLWRGHTAPLPAHMPIKHRRCRVYLRRTPADWSVNLSPRQRQALHAASIARQEKVGIPESKQVKLAA